MNQLYHASNIVLFNVTCNTPILVCHEKLENYRVKQKRIIIESVLIKKLLI